MTAITDLTFFAQLVKAGNFSRAAQELGNTPAAVSKRLAAIERRLGARLLQRTTRRIGLTPEGEMYLVEGARVLADLEALERAVSGSSEKPAGLLRVAATLGFGRKHIAPALSAFARQFPAVELQLQLTDKPVDLVGQGLDLQIRLGDMPDSNLTARLLAHNRRVLCAAAAYLDAAGTPAHPRELARHACLFIREHDETFGTWQLQCGGRSEKVKVRGPLAANDGESVVGWALDGHGILVRSEWDLARYLDSGRLKVVLPEFTLPAADLFVYYPSQRNQTLRARAFIDFLAEHFQAPLKKP